MSSNKSSTRTAASSVISGVVMGCAVVVITGAASILRLIGQRGNPAADILQVVVLIVFLVVLLWFVRKQPTISIWAGVTVLVLIAYPLLVGGADQWRPLDLAWDPRDLWSRASGTTEAPLLGALLLFAPLLLGRADSRDHKRSVDHESPPVSTSGSPQA